MIKVEIDYLKKLREMKKRQQQSSKYSLPKHQIGASKSQLAKMVMNDESRNASDHNYASSRERIPAKKGSQNKFIAFKPNVLLSNRSRKNFSPSNNSHSPSPISQKIKPVLDSQRSKERIKMGMQILNNDNLSNM